MNKVVRTREEAWEEAGKFFPMGYEKDEGGSQRAGHPIYRDVEEGGGRRISDLGDRLEVNTPERTVDILIRPDDGKEIRFRRYGMVHYRGQDGNSQEELQMLAADVIRYGKILDECHHVSQRFFPDGTESVIETGGYCISVLNEVTEIRYWVHFSGCRVTEIIECR